MRIELIPEIFRPTRFGCARLYNSINNILSHSPIEHKLLTYDNILKLDTVLLDDKERKYINAIYNDRPDLLVDATILPEKFFNEDFVLCSPGSTISKSTLLKFCMPFDGNTISDNNDRRKELTLNCTKVKEEDLEEYYKISQEDGNKPVFEGGLLTSIIDMDFFLDEIFEELKNYALLPSHKKWRETLETMKAEIEEKLFTELMVNEKQLNDFNKRVKTLGLMLHGKALEFKPPYREEVLIFAKTLKQAQSLNDGIGLRIIFDNILDNLFKSAHVVVAKRTSINDGNLFCDFYNKRISFINELNPDYNENLDFFINFFDKEEYRKRFLHTKRAFKYLYENMEMLDTSFCDKLHGKKLIEILNILYLERDNFPISKNEEQIAMSKKLAEELSSLIALASLNPNLDSVSEEFYLKDLAKELRDYSESTTNIDEGFFLYHEQITAKAWVSLAYRFLNYYVSKGIKDFEKALSICQTFLLTFGSENIIPSAKISRIKKTQLFCLLINDKELTMLFEGIDNIISTNEDALVSEIERIRILLLNGGEGLLYSRPAYETIHRPESLKEHHVSWGVQKVGKDSAYDMFHKDIKRIYCEEILPETTKEQHDTLNSTITDKYRTKTYNKNANGFSLFNSFKKLSHNKYNFNYENPQTIQTFDCEITEDNYYLYCHIDTDSCCFTEHVFFISSSKSCIHKYFLIYFGKQENTIVINMPKFPHRLTNIGFSLNNNLFYKQPNKIKIKRLLTDKQSSYNYTIAFSRWSSFWVFFSLFDYIYRSCFYLTSFKTTKGEDFYNFFREGFFFYYKLDYYKKRSLNGNNK